MRRAVAPRVGALIETHQPCLAYAYRKSHPEWVRGLKLTDANFGVFNAKSHPEWVRGLKLGNTIQLLLSNSRTPSGCVD